MIINRKTQLLLTAILLAASFLLTSRVRAAATSTLRGAAWWGNQYQYLYFNCLDDVTGDRLDDPYNLCGGSLGSALLCGSGNYVFHFFSTPCINLVHGVYIGNNGNFSGQAWNYTRGLVNFYATSTPDSYAFTSGCPQPNVCTSANNCSACYNEVTQQVHGWAQVAADGTWIKLDSTPTATTTAVQLQSWNLASSTSPYYSLSPGDFIGDATTTANSLSFNCLSEGGAGGTCATRNYKVYISNLQIGHLTAPNWSYSQACTGGALQAVLNWNIKSGSALSNSQQAGYEIVVNSANHFSTSTSDYVCWSGVKYPSVASQYVLPNSDPTCGALAYNTNYYWWIRLWDASGTTTPWYQFGAVDGHNGLVDTHTNVTADASATVFATYKHEFPLPYFTYAPTPILVSTTTNFTSLPNSVYYTSAAPSTTPSSCGLSGCRYLWSTNDSQAIIGSSSAATSTIIFHQATGTTVNLNVTDTDNYICSTSTTFYVNYDLPIWREIKAQ
jgi:hypothetical protein